MPDRTSSPCNDQRLDSPVRRANRYRSSHQSHLVLELSGLPDEDFGEIGVDLPGAHLIGMGESVSGDSAADAHVVELLLGCPEADLDVSEAFAAGGPGKSQAEKLIPT
jgi:hypothetical protein